MRPSYSRLMHTANKEIPSSILVIISWTNLSLKKRPIETQKKRTVMNKCAEKKNTNAISSIIYEEWDGNLHRNDFLYYSLMKDIVLGPILKCYSNSKHKLRISNSEGEENNSKNFNVLFSRCFYHSYPILIVDSVESSAFKVLWITIKWECQKKSSDICKNIKIYENSLKARIFLPPFFFFQYLDNRYW